MAAEALSFGGIAKNYTSVSLETLFEKAQVKRFVIRPNSNQLEAKDEERINILLLAQNFFHAYFADLFLVVCDKNHKYFS